MRFPGLRSFLHRRVLVGVVVVLAAAAGLGTWFATRSSASPAFTSEIVTAGLTTIDQTASATGTIEPASQANVDFAVAGEVTAVDVAVGQTVTAGQTLATVDPSALQADLTAAQAELDADNTKLSSDSASGSSAAELDADKAGVTAAQSAVTSAQDSLEDATLTAPIAGTVASVDLAVGQQVTGTGGNSSNTGGTGSGGSDSSSFAGASSTSSSSSSSSSDDSSSSTQIVIIDTSSWVVDASVDDSAISEIQRGDQAQIDPEGSSSTVYGTVGSIGLIATQSSGVASFPVTVNVTGDPSGLYTGMTANLTIIVKQLNDVLAVPTAALRFSDGSVEVELVHNGADVMQPVTVGTTSGGEAEITQGLAVGDKVVETIVRSTGVSGTGRSRTGGFGGAGFGGGGFGGGGFGGGGFGGFGGG